MNILFDYLLFPILCVFYNQLTFRSNLKGILLKLFLFSIPMTLAEVFFERKTKLIKFNKNWHWYHTLLSETFIMLFVRMFIGLIRIIQSKKSF
ncbi:CBO0543 family protein [Metabacillus sp. KUDC1714]|uniref:CBO0543 family protein n=1 Tax=Metabacillus TaxID=2675233 RepID=UPI0037CB459F